MALELSGLGIARGSVDVRPARALLRTFVIAAGLGWSAAFVIVGLHYQLQMYGDGSLFSYAVAVQDAWSFHWHNISGRLSVYLLSCLPAQSYVALTADAHGGVQIYGALFFGSQLLGLAATWHIDRSPSRIIFSSACLSAACLCPLVFGFPTEMWMAHALFWPAMALAHHGRGGLRGAAALFAMLLALMLTHEGALILGGIIVAGLSLRGLSDRRFIRALVAYIVALSIWAAVKIALPPDGYDAPVMASAAMHFFDAFIFRNRLLLVLASALLAYGLVWLELQRLAPARAHLYATAIAAAGLCGYWLTFDHALHAEYRYYLRTVLLIGTAFLGALAALAVVLAEGGETIPAMLRQRLQRVAASDTAARLLGGAVALIMLVHAVETAKFAGQWGDYKTAVRALAIGADADPALGDPRFVSTARMHAGLDALSWSSTTPYLSVLVAPQFAPKRLVIDPDNGYFWLSCRTATASRNAVRAVPAETRSLVRALACLHR